MCAVKWHNHIYFYFPDDSDAPRGLVHHLPRRLLKGQAQLRKRRKAATGKRLEAETDSESDEEEEEDKEKWSKTDPGLLGTKTPPFVKPVLSADDAAELDKLSTAYDYYKLFQSEKWVEEIVFQSKLYAVQENLPQALDIMSVDSYRCVEALLLHSGYHSVPQRRRMWETKADCHNSLVADAIRRREADAVLACLHFRDNMKIEPNGDNYYKVRPIFHNLNQASKRWFSSYQKFSVDEVMIPYYGRHSSKQYIHGKPVKYGFKVWAICTSDGSGVWFEPYCGRHTLIQDGGFGQGPNVVLDLVQKVGLLPGSQVFFDNLFTSFPLLRQLSEMGLAGTGTVRQNRLKKVTLIPTKKEMGKKTLERGYSKAVYKEDQVLVAWKDSKGVFVASNKHSAESSTTCKRFCRTKRTHIMVRIPDMIREYNIGMGGVDLLDALVACYRYTQHTLHIEHIHVYLFFPFLPSPVAHLPKFKEIKKNI